MAVYKVIQDIEAEDKLLGPLTLKGFIYAIIAGTSAFIEFRLMLIGTPLKWPFMFLFAIPMILFGVLASPLGREQPTEVWLLSRIRFFLKPRLRIWDQSGIQDLVTITVPKKKELHLTKDLSPDEVQSRLKTLAMTLDTRGWAIKNVDVNLSTPESQVQNATLESDRLIGGFGVPQQMPVVDVHAADDIMDEKNNPTAKKFEAMMKSADEERKRGLLATIKGLVDKDEERAHKASKSKKHEVKEITYASPDTPAIKAKLQEIAKEQDAAKARRKAEKEAELEKKLADARSKFSQEIESGHKKPSQRHKVLSSDEQPKPPAQPEAPVPTTVTAASQTVNMELAQSGSAFSVATLSQLANRPGKIEKTGPNEITISLH